MKPNRVVIKLGGTPFVTAVYAERPEGVVIIIHSLEMDEDMVYRDGDILPLGVVKPPPEEATEGEWRRVRPEVEYEVAA